MAITAAAMMAPSVLADTLNVPAPYTTIQAAIDASADGDAIVIAAGTYTGLGNKDLTCAGRAITIRGASMATCIIDLQGSGTAFILDAGEGPNTRIEQLTIRDSATGGLGLRCIGASPTIVDCTFETLVAPADGPAVHVEDGSPRFERCQFVSNVSTSEHGGAIYQSGGTVAFDACEFQSNRVAGALGNSRGGAICTRDGSLIVTGGRFTSNRAVAGFEDDVFTTGNGHGGAIDAMNATVVIRDAAFDDNGASGGDWGMGLGGAIKLHTSTGSIERCEFSENTAWGATEIIFGSSRSGHGGAMWIKDGSFAFRDCDFTGNGAFSYGADNDSGDSAGGAVFLEGATQNSFARCRFEQNETVDGRGGALLGTNVTLVGCTFTDNRAEQFYVSADAPVGGGAVIGDGVLINCLITGNVALFADELDEGLASGHGLATSGTTVIINCTITDNGAPGYFIGTPDAIWTGGSTIARNSIIRVEDPALPALKGPTAMNAAFCNVSGGAPGPGNIDADPGFTGGASPYQLAAGSPCVDAGDDGDLPTDWLDVNDDGDVYEPLPVDLAGETRVVGVAVDMGAYEQFCFADLDGTGGIGFGDLTKVLNAWGPCNAICGCMTSATTWQNHSIGRLEGTLTVELDHRPLIDQTDALVTLGLSPLSGPTFDDYAILVRLSPAGHYDVRNGSTYTSDAQVFYTAGQTNHIRIEADIRANTYSVWVTPEGGVETQIAANYAFRTTQQGITALDTLGVWGFEPAAHKVCDVVYGAAGVTGSCPCLPDLDGNGTVGFSDLTLLIAQWGACP